MAGCQKQFLSNAIKFEIEEQKSVFSFTPTLLFKQTLLFRSPTLITEIYERGSRQSV